MFSLEEIFEQAIADYDSGVFNDRCNDNAVRVGVKICKCKQTGQVRIFDTHARGGYYRELSADECRIFMEHGWKFGIFTVAIASYESRLARIKDRVNEFTLRKRFSEASDAQKYHDELEQMMRDLITRKQKLFKSKI